MEEKVVASTVMLDDAESDKAIKKLLKDGGDIDVLVRGVEKPAYWQEIGFEKRPFIKGYSYKKIRDCEDENLLTKKQIKRTIFVKEDFVILDPTPSCLSGVLVTGTDEYTYNRDINAVYFKNVIKKEIEVEYYTYEEKELYDEIYYNSITVAMIFYSVKHRDNRKKNFFESLDSVGSLSTKDVMSIMNSYIEKVKVKDDDLKKSQGPQASGVEEDTPKDTT